MTHPFSARRVDARACRRLTIITLVALAPLGNAAAQTVTVPLTADEWTATDSIRFGTFFGRPGIWISRGVAMSRNARFRNGTLEFDIAADSNSANFGIGFRAQRPDAEEVLLFRPPLSGRPDALQYAPALNSIGASWQIYHGAGFMAPVALPLNTWIHVRLRVEGDSARVWVGPDTAVALVVPHLVLGGNGAGIALWASLFPGGGYYAGIRYTADSAPHDTTPPPLPSGTIVHWRLSQAVDATTLPADGSLPRLTALHWEPVRAEWPGLVLVNRYRHPPGFIPPAARDSVLHGRVRGSSVVFARTTIIAGHAGRRLLHFGYSDNIRIWCNGQPLYSGVNAYGFRDLGYFNLLGDAVYLPLRKGPNEVVVAVTEFFGGWAFSGQLGP